MSHVTKAQLWQIIKTNPNILTLSVDDNLEPSIGIIQSSLELSDEELTKVIVRESTVLTHELSTEKLTLRLLFLREILKLQEGDNTKLRKAIIRTPTILNFPEERMLEMQN